MIGNFLSSAQSAQALLAKKGTSITVTRHGTAAFDPVTQARTGAAQTETFAAAVFPPGRDASFKINTLEHQNAQEVYFALLGKSFQPGPGDTFEWLGKGYTIFWSQTYNPAGDQPILTLAYAE